MIGLQALGGEGRVTLFWGPPADLDSAPVTGYSVYRGTAPDNQTPIRAGEDSTTFIDLTAKPNVTFYYSIAAESTVGEGPSPEVIEGRALPAAPGVGAAPERGSGPFVIPREGGGVILLAIVVSFVVGALFNQHVLKRVRRPPEE